MVKQIVKEMNLGGGTVSVACKLPNGLVLQLFNMVDGSEPVMGGGFRTVKKAEKVGSPITLKGFASPFGVAPDHRIIGGYAITEGVPAEFFAKWMKDNEGSDLVKNRLIFAHEQTESVVDFSKDHKTNRCGLEPIMPDKDPRIPKRIGAVGAITTADEQKKSAAA